MVRRATDSVPARPEPPRPADVPQTLATWAPTPEDFTEPGTRLSELHVVGADLRGLDLRSVRWSESRLERVDLSGSRLRAGGFVDAVLEGVDFSNLRADGAELVRVEIRNSRLTGIEWHEGLLRDVLFEGCRLDLASFRFSTFERVAFRDCRLDEADLYAVEAKSLVLESTSLVRAKLSQARLAAAELRGCELAEISGVEGLRGAAMTWPDIVQLTGEFAAAVGVSVLDE